MTRTYYPFSTPQVVTVRHYHADGYGSDALQQLVVGYYLDGNTTSYVLAGGPAEGIDYTGVEFNLPLS